MIVVFPPGMRHDKHNAPSYYEDHLLERVSLLELRLVQMSESLSLAMEIIREQNRTLRDEHNLIRELHKTLESFNADEKRSIKPNWDKLIAENDAEDISPRINEIMLASEISNPEMLELLTREAFKYIEEKDERKTFAVLKRAEPIAPKNAPLLLLFAEQLFYADKFDEAKQKLETAFKIAPENEQVRLLLGTIYADELETDKAEEIFQFAAKNERVDCGVNIVSGMIAAFEKDWSLSAAFFEKSLKKYEFAENRYLLACVFFQTQEYERSLEQFQKTVQIDNSFTDAYFLKSLVHDLLDQKEEADEAAQMAIKTVENGAQCLEFFDGKKLPDLRVALPFFHFKGEKRLLTGGAQRIRKFFRSFVFHIGDSR